MKKQFILGILATALFLSSCKKNSLPPPSSQPVNSKMGSTSTNKDVTLTVEGYLYFSTPDAFEQVIGSLSNASDQQLDLWERNLGFTSAYTYYNIKAHEENGTTVEDAEFKNSVYEDDMILRFTNKKGIVQIGDYLFKLEMDNGYILQMYQQDKKTYFTDFENGRFVSSAMNKLNNSLDTKEESIWEFLGKNPKGLQPMSIIGSIRDIWGARTKYAEEGSSASVDQGWRYKVIGSYQNLAIYHSIIIKFQYEKEGNPLPQRTVMNINTAVGSPIQTWGRIYWSDWAPRIKAPNTNDFIYDNTKRFLTKWRMYEGGSAKVYGADISLYVNYEDRNDGIFKEMYYYWEKPL